MRVSVPRTISEGWKRPSILPAGSGWPDQFSDETALVVKVPSPGAGVPLRTPFELRDKSS